MYGRQPHLLVDVTLGLAPQTTTAPDMTKFIQKMREHAKWAWKKAKTFQAKEAEWHKCNYDKCSRAAALEVVDTVLVHVTMLWKSGPLPMYQFMWYASGMWKAAARPYIGTICFPSTPTQGRMRRMHPWWDLRVTTLQL